MSSFTCNSILLKSSFKNRFILLNNFKIEIFYCIVDKLVANATSTISFTARNRNRVGFGFGLCLSGPGHVLYTKY